MSGAYYNENDKAAAAWLRELIKAGHIAPGDVDERSIEDVLPAELRGYAQCHFFAGIGGWAYALRLAGWPDDQAVWTGSCPCQPFSAAGKGGGFADERHLWPAWHHLISECRPAVVFGEQVASRDVGPWIDLVHDDMEALGYAFGAVPFPAASLGAPHIRDRLYWVADAGGTRLEGGDLGAMGGQCAAAQRGGSFGGLANMHGSGLGAGREGLAAVGYGSPTGADCSIGAHGPAGPTNGHWRDADWIFCRDGKWRPVEPGSFPLDDGLPARVGRLRGYGNAIAPQAAEAFIRAYTGATNK
jgi:DNA (cytosine-5)-methyltransferase 1